MKERVLRRLAAEIDTFGSWDDRNALTTYLATLLGIALQLLLAVSIAAPA